MPFNAALAGGQITQVRKTKQAFEHYLLVNPNDIVWQAEVDDTKTGENYGEFQWANTQEGVRANVIADQVLLVTTSKTDLSTVVIRGRVREVPDADTVFINETGTDITDAMYITVLDDFDIVERLQRVGPDGTKYKDWDNTWSDLPPMIDGLQSVYADFSGANPVTLSFAPTAAAIASGAAIDTWLWDVDDGTITVGNVNTQNITATFPGYGVNEHRWVHLTVTDDAGNATAFHFEVYTVNKHSSTAVKLDTGQLQITSSIEEGWNATITAWDGMAQSEVLDQTRVAIAGIDDYDGTATPIVSNIMMVGRLRIEQNVTSAQEREGATAAVDWTIEGFATQLARLPAPALHIIDDAGPNEWGEMIDPTPTRAIVYYLAFHTTYMGLSSISSDDLTDYVLGDFTVGETIGLEFIDNQLKGVNGVAAFAPSGETTLRRMASYQPDADRAGLTTVFDFTTEDITPELGMNLEYGELVGEIEAGAVVYNTTDDEIDFRYIGRAPATSFGSGHESAQLNGQVLIADSTDDDARDELKQRTADHLAYINNKVTLDLGLMDGFWFAIPTLHQRWTFTLEDTDTERGREYSDSDFWQLLSTSYIADNETNTREFTATFEEETQGENAGISIALVGSVNDLDYSLPPMSAYDTFPDDGLTNFPTDDPDEDPYFGGGMLSVMQPDQNNQDAGANCETLNIAMYGDYSRATTRNTELGETYTITVKGETAFPAGWSHIWDFTSSNGGWVANNAGGGARGTYVAATGWQSDLLTEGVNHLEVTQIYKNFGAIATITDIKITFDFTNGQQVAPPNLDTRIQGWTAGFDGNSEFTSYQDSGDGDDQTFAWIGPDSLDAVSVQLRPGFKNGGDPAPTGDALITQIQIEGTESNPFGPDGSDHGDAFYTDYVSGSANLYGGGEGLLVNGDTPVGIPSFQSNHEYVFTIAGTGGPLSFKFKLSDYTGVDRNVLQISICGPNMGTTT